MSCCRHFLFLLLLLLLLPNGVRGFRHCSRSPRSASRTRRSTASTHLIPKGLRGLPPICIRVSFRDVTSLPSKQGEVGSPKPEQICIGVFRIEKRSARQHIGVGLSGCKRCIHTGDFRVQQLDLEILAVVHAFRRARNLEMHAVDRSWPLRHGLEATGGGYS